MLLCSLMMVTFAAMTSSNPCNDPHPGPDMPHPDWRSFHWFVLGVSNQSASEKLEKLVEVLLEGFNCEARLRETRSHCHHRYDSCLQVKQDILSHRNYSDTEPAVGEIASRALLFGLDLEHLVCRHLNEPRPPPSCKMHLGGRFMDFRLTRRWRPELMRHLVWRDCTESEAFVKRRNCFKLPFSQHLSFLPCERVLELVSHLIQGDRIVTSDNQMCDLQFTEQIFREFGNTSQHSSSWRIDKHGLTSILKNLSNPYPPVPAPTRSNDNHHNHFQFWSKIEHPDPNIDGGNIEPQATNLLRQDLFRPQDSKPPRQGSFRPETKPHHQGTFRPEATTSSEQGTFIPVAATSSEEGPVDTPIQPPMLGRYNGGFPPVRPKHKEKDNSHETEDSMTDKQDLSSLKKKSPKPSEHEEEPTIRYKRRPDTNRMFPDRFQRPFEDPTRPHHSPLQFQRHRIWNASILLDLYGIEDDQLTMFRFSELCPVLLNQLLFVYNLPVVPAPGSDSGRQGTTTEVYGYGSLSVLLISLCSLVGVVFVKCSNERIKNYVMATMLALAVGNLCGDAILHLIPEVIGAKGYDVDGDGHYTNEVMLIGESDINLSSVKMMLMLASIYLFFLLEMVTSICHTHDHDLEVVEITESQIPKKQTLRRVTGSNACQQDASTSDNQPSMEVAIHNPEYFGSPLPSVPEEEAEEQEAEARIQVTVKKKDQNNLQAPMTLAWMVVVGDGIHNFADGLEIGATFSSGLASGLSTSLAVICHELPHELGDFAVLISTGMSIKRAMALNFVSALTAFVGLYVGILTGQHDDVRELIFAVGAGMFLYVALGNLVPELMKYFQKYRNWTMFLCQNIGLLFGYVAMVLIAIYEDEIVVH